MIEVTPKMRLALQQLICNHQVDAEKILKISRIFLLVAILGVAIASNFLDPVSSVIFAVAVSLISLQVFRFTLSTIKKVIFITISDLGDIPLEKWFSLVEVQLNGELPYDTKGYVVITFMDCFGKRMKVKRSGPLKTEDKDNDDPEQQVAVAFRPKWEPAYEAIEAGARK